jgi:hypothetical protein
MTNDPRDPRAFRTGIAFLGLAATVAIAGLAWAVVEYQDAGRIPNELWIGAGAIGGAFVGALIHFPMPSVDSPSQPDAWKAVLANAGVALVVVLLAAGCGALIVAEAKTASSAWCGLGATAGGLLLGLLIPSPGRGDW